MDARHQEYLSRLLSAAQDGDGTAYETFLKEVAAELRPFFKRQIKASESVEDVLQDTLLSIHRARHSFRPERTLAPWIYAIAQNRLTDFFRRFRLLEKRELELEEGFEIGSGNAMDLDGSAKSDRVKEELARLPYLQRQVIELLKLDDLSVKEVAVKLGLSEANVKVTASRGYQAIRKAMGVNRDEN